MPFRFSLMPEHGRVEVELEGDASPTEVGRLLDKVTSDAAYDAGFHWLIDARAVARPATKEEIGEMIRFLGRVAHRMSGRVAIVVEGPVHLGVARMAAIQAEDVGIDIGVFQSVGLAVGWLDDEEAAPAPR